MLPCSYVGDASALVRFPKAVVSRTGQHGRRSGGGRGKVEAFSGGRMLETRLGMELIVNEFTLPNRNTLETYQSNPKYTL